ncbi:imidazole glycerol phosphate synthase subunit HisF [Oenococcus kitaharae]|uniref:Imidazole glycerol phosphate synthase subunit HisF n=1 Tax=Oenococcus kitaharae DSM 17330 TaxID=1045004 RepID=G9WHC2_9LACO|nr:imidazole glycerol phosphate synthase subunit HisF [Oenococcus kitaharae]EHN59767.1 Imidazole glycerol phosphate synthase cyclase subunit [Oenococcus kitaharae DSM 17330]OEY83591.1 imidazole glycerol phosphate synthase [Oenococcus kitaharae]OEY85389.1 imidazole glycerol phosphate synthase [Oenococcus kitaharae]OEY86242.1 imidazole glycerol phosphate synthase [Oenococcus kitaharae]
MLAKRIIPCLDIDDNRVKKGVNFLNLKDVGDPAEIAAEYERQGADELVFLDITATNEKRGTMIDVVQRVSSQVFMPLTVGGGISNLAQMQALLKAGADKISLNSAAIAHPELIQQAAEKFGRQCVVVAIDVKKDPDSGEKMVYSRGGKERTSLKAVDWAKKAVALGAGELLITSMDQDGTKKGFDIALYQKISALVNVPIIASGGAGSIEDFKQIFRQTDVAAALAASVFHYGQLTIPEVKRQLTAAGVAIRS